MFFLREEVICVLLYWIRRRLRRSHFNLLLSLRVTTGGRPLVELNKTQQLITLHNMVWISTSVKSLTSEKKKKNTKKSTNLQGDKLRRTGLSIKASLGHWCRRGECPVAWQRLVDSTHKRLQKKKLEKHKWGIKGRKRSLKSIYLINDLRWHNLYTTSQNVTCVSNKCRGSSVRLACNRRSHCYDKSLSRPLLVQKLDTALVFCWNQQTCFTLPFQFTAASFLVIYWPSLFLSTVTSLSLSTVIFRL